MSQKRGFATSATAGFVALVATVQFSEAAIVANFSGGDGTASSDQWTGVAGDGWATAWGSTGAAAGTGVVSTAPLGSGGDYLQFVDNNTTTTAFARRQYQTSGEVDISQPYRISLSYRFDGNIAQFGSFNDRIAIFGDTSPVASSATTNTWLIGVTASNTGAGAGQSSFPGEWYFIDNNGSNAFATSNMFRTNLVFVPGRTYSVTIDVDPTTGTYDASIDDGVNPAVSATDLTFRRGAGAAAGSWLHISANADAATDNSAFSIDSITITIPEPSAAALLAASLGGLLSLRRRRC